MQEALIKERQLKQEESCWARVEHVRRLDVEPENRLTYRQKALGHKFGHRAKKSRNYAKDIGVAEVNWPIEQQAEREKYVCIRFRQRANKPMTYWTTFDLLYNNCLDRNRF